MCVRAPALQRIVIMAASWVMGCCAAVACGWAPQDGFEWINESKTLRPKWGMVGTKVGSKLSIKIDTRGADDTAEAMAQQARSRSVPHGAHATWTCRRTGLWACACTARHLLSAACCHCFGPKFGRACSAAVHARLAWFKLRQRHQALRGGALPLWLRSSLCHAMPLPLAMPCHACVRRSVHL